METCWPPSQILASRNQTDKVKQICCKPFVSSHLRLRRLIPKKSTIKHGQKCGNHLRPARLLPQEPQVEAKGGKRCAKYVPKVRLKCA